MMTWAGLFQGASQPLYRAFEIKAVGDGRKRLAVTEKVLASSPFLSLRQFSTGRNLPRILIVPPLSGHFPILMRDVVVALLADFDVAVLDWANVRHVAVAQGAFDFDDNIRAVQDAIRSLGPRASVLALCQGGVPALAAIADLARDTPDLAPAALVLVAAPVDPLANPTAVVRLIRGRSEAWYDVVPIARVPADHEGRGRWVYPAEVQLAALELYRNRRIDTGSEIGRKLAQDDGADPERFPFADLYTAVMDIDARQFTQNISKVFLNTELPAGLLRFAGRLVDPGSLRDTALMTVEGALDDIAAPGQTASAHGLCRNLADSRRKTLVVSGAGHFSLFHGRLWREEISPRVRAHCLRHAGRDGPKGARRKTVRR